MTMEGPSNAETYAKYAEELLRFATVLVGPQDAPDILSAAVLRAFASRGWPTVENRRAFLFRCVDNESRRRTAVLQRRRRAEERSRSREAVNAPVGDPDVVAALHRLSDRQRAVIYLTY